MVAIVGSYACVDRYDVEIPRGHEVRLAIDGIVSMDEDFPHTSVSITRLFDFTADGAKPPLISAVTLLEGEAGRIPLDKYNQTSFGIRQGVDNRTFIPTFGRTYQIEVEHLDGSIYRSQPERMLKSPSIAAISVDTVTREIISPILGIVQQPSIRFKVDVDLGEHGEATRYLLWHYRFFAFVTETFGWNIKGVALMSTNDLSTDQLKDFSIFEKQLNNEFPQGYGFELEQYALTETAYRYWQQVSETIDRNGNQFEPAPGIVLGNMTNLTRPEEVVYGFFYASERSFNHIYINP